MITYRSLTTVLRFADYRRIQPLFVISFTALMAIALVGSGRAMSQERVSIRAQVDLDEVYIGESIRLQVLIENAKGVAKPSLGNLQSDFDITFVGESPMQQSSTSFVNGRVTSQTLFQNTLEYSLTARKLGEFEVPTLEIEFQGKKYKSSPIKLRVVEPEAQDTVLVEVRASTPHVYPTQSFDVSLVILVKGLPEVEQDPVRILVRKPPEIKLPWVNIPDGLESQDSSSWLNGYLSEVGYGFSINGLSTSGAFLFDSPRLALFNLYDGKEKRIDSNGEEVTYYRYVISRTFKATRPGKFTFGPAMVKGTFPVHHLGEQLVGKRLAAISTSLEITSKDVPATRPDSFVGGIGDYRIEATATPVRCQVGDPITLTLSLASPNGNLDLISAPKLTHVPEIESGFELLDPDPVGVVDNGVKRYRYAMRPKSTGSTIPAFTFHVFDPVSETFQPIRTEPISLDISEAEIVNLKNDSSNTAPVLRDNSGKSLGESEMTGLQLRSIRSIPVGKTVWDIRNVLTGIGVSWGAALLLLATALIRHRWNQSFGDNRRVNLRSQLQSAMVDARGKLALGNGADALRSLRHCLVQIVLDSPTGNAQELATGELMNTANERGYSASTLSTLEQLLSDLDAKFYSHQQNSSDSLLVDRFEQVLGDLLQESLPSKGAVSSNQSKAQTISKCILWFALYLGGLGAPASAFAQEESQPNTPDLAAIETALRKMDLSTDSADARSIATQIESQIQDIVQRPGLVFQLGNAWYLAGEPAKALYCFELASRFWPADAVVRHNRELARFALETGEEGVQTSQEEGAALAGLMRFAPSYWFQLAICALAGIAAAFGLVIGCLCRGRVGKSNVGWRSIGWWMCGSGAVTAMVLASLIGTNSPELYFERMAIVSHAAVGREGMSESSGQAFPERLRAGEQIQVLQRTPNWTFVRHSQFGDAWIETSKLIYQFR